MSHFVYILRCADGSLYCGYTTDIKKRVKEHNGRSTVPGAKYTMSRRPVTLRYVEAYETKSEAMSREYAIKQLTRDDKLALLKKFTKVTLANYLKQLEG